MTCGIYLITNKNTGKRYIGQSINIEKRFNDHIKKGSNKCYIDRSINKHGENAFDFNILLECDESQLSDEEEKFIKLYGTYKQGYNLTWGGEIPPSKHPEIAKKISESHKGKNNHFYGKHHSDETRKKMSESHKGKSISDETKKKIAKAHNSTGYYRVYKDKTSSCKQGFTWVYIYRENGKDRRIYSVDIDKLKEKVLDKGLKWEILDKEKAKENRGILT